jgi:hypothetical protein
MLTALQCAANVVDSETILVPASDLQNNFLDLKDMNLLPIWNGELHIYSRIKSYSSRTAQTMESGHPAHMPNPDHAFVKEYGVGKTIVCTRHKLDVKRD